MRFDRSQEPEAHDPEASRPEAHPPADPHALLALQRSAGNAAVGRMLSRYYTREGDGTLLWRTEPYDKNVWERTGWTTWKLIPYGVYERKFPELVADDVLDVPEKSAKKTRRGGRGKKKKTATTARATEPIEQQTAETELEEEPTEENDEPTEAETRSDPPSRLEDDDDDWTDVRSRGAVKAERDMARDVDALAGIIDAHTGAAAQIGTSFNQLFNARVRQGLEVEGTITSSYTTSFDRGRSGYSVEVTIPGLANWVIHAHLDATGALVPGENAIHYKRSAERYTLGVSIALTTRQIDGLLPDEGTRARWRTTERRGTL